MDINEIKKDVESAVFGENSMDFTFCAYTLQDVYEHVFKYIDELELKIKEYEEKE